MQKQILEQNKILIGLLTVMVEMLPNHSRDCYGLQVHPSNTNAYCNCEMDEIRKKVRGLMKKGEK